jgi:hypothetical protein
VPVLDQTMQQVQGPRGLQVQAPEQQVRDRV